MAAPDWAMFLDVDGTLVDYAPHPDAVHLPPSLLRTLRTLTEALDGAVALVSGRAIVDLDRLFAPERFSAAGQHGAEARRDEDYHVFVPSPRVLKEVLVPAYEMARARPRIRVEDKGLSATIHYRGAEGQRDTLHDVLRRAIAQSGQEFRLLASHLAFDIMPVAANKGSALDWFMSAAPFAGRVPVFVGDDRTDEDGFAAAIARGGRAIKVGEPKGSVAPWHVEAPQQLHHWLERSLAGLERRA